MHKFYHELEKRCDDRDRLIHNIRSYKRSIRLIDESIINCDDLSFKRDRLSQRKIYKEQVNNMIEDLKIKRRIIRRYFDGAPRWRKKKNENEIYRINEIIKRSKETIPSDVLLCETINK